MRLTLSKPESALLLACLALLALALIGPAVVQPIGYHEFADQRSWHGMPCALNVLSNLPFALTGLAGAYYLKAVPQGVLGKMQRAIIGLFFGGLLLTAAASSYYHWRPDDAGLAMDRLGMAVAFAGLLGLAACTRVSVRAGAALNLALLPLAPLAVQTWSTTGNVLPWATLQFGGLALIVWLALLRHADANVDVHWGFVILAYLTAKLLEMSDREIYESTGHLVSGHTLKHAVAALAALPVIAAVRALRGCRHNAAGSRSLP